VPAEATQFVCGLQINSAKYDAAKGKQSSQLKFDVQSNHEVPSLSIAFPRQMAN